MSYLVDTNVVSELIKPGAEPNVNRWFNETPEHEICLSVISLTEIRLGIETMSGGQRRAQLLSWLETDLPARFELRMVPVDSLVADTCGKFLARAKQLGKSIELADGLLAATAEAYSMTLVTRNTKHFEGLGIELLNPWLSR